MKTAVSLLSSLLLGSLAHAQTDPAPSPVPNVTVSEPIQSVSVSAKRKVLDPLDVVTAKSKVLSRKFASSCAFMSVYNPAEDEVMLKYLSDFNSIGNTAGNGLTIISDTAPNGDVSNTALSSSIEDPMAGVAMPNSMEPAVKCGQNDTNFAAGRNAIARKDKSLEQAFDALDRNDYATALQQFNVAWKKVGYEEAALMLGKMNLYGQGTPRDTAQAVKWFREVVEARYDPSSDRLRFNPNNPGALNTRCEAAMTLAKIYLLGSGVPKDANEARKWYAKAADMGYVPANNTLGLAYLGGLGGEKNAAKGLQYLKEGAEAGYTLAQYNLARAYYTGENGVGQNLAQAGAWFVAAGKGGNADALFAAGRMYDLGEGVTADQKRALVYYKESAVKGNADAQAALATYFYSGQEVTKDLATARKLFNEAALHGQPDAMYNLGVMSALGEGGPKDVAMGYVWLSLAKASSNEQAGPALKAIEPQLTAQDRAKADAILKPAPKAKAG